MNDIQLPAFERAILAMHGAKAKLSHRAHVEESFDGATVWTGEVLTFTLEGHPTAAYCYCWEVNGEVTAVLGEGPVDSPEAAVRASILADEEPAEGA